MWSETHEYDRSWLTEDAINEALEARYDADSDASEPSRYRYTVTIARDDFAEVVKRCSAHVELCDGGRRMRLSTTVGEVDVVDGSVPIGSLMLTRVER